MAFLLRFPRAKCQHGFTDTHTSPWYTNLHIRNIISTGNTTKVKMGQNGLWQTDSVNTMIDLIVCETGVRLIVMDKSFPHQNQGTRPWWSWQDSTGDGNERRKWAAVWISSQQREKFLFLGNIISRWNPKAIGANEWMPPIEATDHGQWSWKNRTQFFYAL